MDSFYKYNLIAFIKNCMKDIDFPFLHEGQKMIDFYLFSIFLLYYWFMTIEVFKDELLFRVMIYFQDILLKFMNSKKNFVYQTIIEVHLDS